MNAPLTDLPRILFVDDEPRVLDSLALTLRREYEVHLANGADEALSMLKSKGPFSVICSDMRMPGTNGATLLSMAMRMYPETTRILLTGEPGRDAAVNAVNEGQIFRFLTKPCPQDRLKTAIAAGVAQHQLVSAERVLLQETLIGCIKALVDVLAITNPVAFGRASRVQRLAIEFAADLGCAGFWQLEAAAMLSQLGYLSLPTELVEKMFYGKKLTPEEQVLADGVPQVANRLLANIPRIESVLQILAAIETPQNPPPQPVNASPGQPNLALGARILSLVLDYDAMIVQGVAPDVAIGSLRTRQGKHDPSLITKLSDHVGTKSKRAETREMPLRMVHIGMTFMDELRTNFGVLIVPKGFEVTESFCERMRNFNEALLAENVRMMVRLG